MKRFFPIETKLKAIELYESGMGTTTISRKLKIGKEDTILRWIYSWKLEGIDGLKQKMPKKYTTSFKMEVITWLVTNKASLLDTSKHFNIPNKSSVYQWKRKYDELGFYGLANRQERAKMDNNKQTKDDIIKQLKKDNEVLKAENDYLKKLDAVMKQTEKKHK